MIVDNIAEADRLPIWHLCRNTDMSRKDLVKVVNRLGLKKAVDLGTGNVYLSRSEFGALLRSWAESSK